MGLLKRLIKKETVFVIATIFTIVSMFVVTPNKDYLEYIDFSVLAILFCLMAVVEGFQKIGVFQALSAKILTKTNNGKIIGIVLVLLCFFMAMLVTNDVALITFVPFTIGILGGEDDNLIFVVVMETIAANLGSMMTPIGNPQNLFLFSYYKMDILSFFQTMLPMVVISLILIMAIMVIRKNNNLVISTSQEGISIDRIQLLKYGLLFALCIVTVLHMIHYLVCLGIISFVLLVSDKTIFRKIDYMLLLTFICFFIFVGNVGSIEKIRMLIADFLIGREVLASAMISQGLSNVPAAIMLAQFTENGNQILMGVNIGGLGTIIASMASLISYKYYAVRENSQKGKYMLVFSLINFILLAVLLFINKII